VGLVREIHEHRAVAGGLPMRWLEAGSGWPVVLLHAFPLSADMWRPQLGAVPDEYRFVAPDLCAQPGGGIDGYAANVAAVVDALSIETAAIGGLSMGGYVTFALNRLQPRRFSQMILADTRPQSDTPEGRAARQAMRRLLAEAGSAAVADLMLPRLLSPRAREEQPELVAEVRSMIEAQPPPAVDAAIAAMMDRPDSTADLRSIGVPVLLVAGAEDELTPPEVTREMERRIPRARSVILPDAGHLSSLERPDAFSRVLHDFLLAGR
jgi:pimeloyl-ACP methyl ester carboxylesterase